MDMNDTLSLNTVDDTVYTEIEGVEQEAVTEAQEDGIHNLVIQHMDISEPLTMLRKLLQSRLSTDLSKYEFYLQDVIPLDPSKNLVSQCVQGSGMVQINVEIKHPPGVAPRLNIVDILKPAEEPEPPRKRQAVVQAAQASSSGWVSSSYPPSKKVVIPFPEESENVTRWIVDQNFRREQEQLGIPIEPLSWKEEHVQHWILWAIKEFGLAGVDPDRFSMTGHQLCSLKHEDFIKLVPHDKGDIFWTHLELLRKCKFVAVIQQPTPHAITTITVSTSDPKYAIAGRAGRAVQNRGRKRHLGEDDWQGQVGIKPRTIAVPHTERIISGNRKGNNGQIQLWQFLLELLTDKDYLDVIHWVGEDGEFKLNNPEAVANLWGQRKNKHSMNYEKLSRALRYYYDGDMIAKVHGKRFVYKFVCDLRHLLGYSASELKQQVQECAEKHMINVADTIQHQHHANPRPIILASSNPSLRAAKWHSHHHQPHSSVE